MTSTLEATEYDYQVTFVGNYWTLTTRTSLLIDEQTGNCSDAVRELVEEDASNCIYQEIGFHPSNFAHSCIVTLLLDGEEVQL
jgi:hypothetical protein